MYFIIKHVFFLDSIIFELFVYDFQHTFVCVPTRSRPVLSITMESRKCVDTPRYSVLLLAPNSYREMLTWTSKKSDFWSSCCIPYSVYNETNDMCSYNSNFWCSNRHISVVIGRLNDNWVSENIYTLSTFDFHTQKRSRRTWESHKSLLVVMHEKFKKSWIFCCLKKTCLYNHRISCRSHLSWVEFW